MRILWPTKSERVKIVRWAQPKYESVPPESALAEWDHTGTVRTRRWVRNYDLDQLRQKNPDKFLKHINAKRVVETVASRKGNQLYYSRILGSWDSPLVYWLRYTDPSTEEVYVSGVPHGENVGPKTLRDLAIGMGEAEEYYYKPNGSLGVRKRTDLLRIMTADESMAWKLGITVEQYWNIRQEA